MHVSSEKWRLIIFQFSFGLNHFSTIELIVIEELSRSYESLYIYTSVSVPGFIVSELAVN